MGWIHFHGLLEDIFQINVSSRVYICKDMFIINHHIEFIEITVDEAVLRKFDYKIHHLFVHILWMGHRVDLHHRVPINQ